MKECIECCGVAVVMMDCSSQWYPGDCWNGGHFKLVWNLGDFLTFFKYLVSSFISCILATEIPKIVYLLKLIFQSLSWVWNLNTHWVLVIVLGTWQEEYKAGWQITKKENLCWFLLNTSGIPIFSQMGCKSSKDLKSHLTF